MYYLFLYLCIFFLFPYLLVNYSRGSTRRLILITRPEIVTIRRKEKRDKKYINKNNKQVNISSYQYKNNKTIISTNTYKQTNQRPNIYSIGGYMLFLFKYKNLHWSQHIGNTFWILRATYSVWGTKSELCILTETCKCKLRVRWHYPLTSVFCRLTN